MKQEKAQLALVHHLFSFVYYIEITVGSVNQKLASNKEVNSDEHLYLSLFTYSMLIRDLGIGYMLSHYVVTPSARIG